MFRHHLKIAFRNLRKYKTQNIISIIGLAVGFTCFAFSALWIRYEMSYDSFHPNADRIYRVHTALFKWDTDTSNSSETVQSGTPYLLANWLKKNYPEIEEACAIYIVRRELDPVSILYPDQNFCKIFDLTLPDDFFLEGSTDRTIAVINEKTAESIRERLNRDDTRFTTMPSWQSNTNIIFNTAIPITRRFSEELLNSWDFREVDTYILVKNGVNIKSIMEKLDKVEIPELWSTPISLVLTPLKQLRYKDPTGNSQSDIKFAHIQIFAIAGLLVILCSLFNHLTLNVTLARMRLRELALRKVNGATDRQIAAALYADFLFVVALSLVFGFMLIALFLSTFKDYASIGNANINIYAELAVYSTLLILCSFAVSSVPVLYSRKQLRTGNVMVLGKPGSRNMFRKGVLSVQLIISLGMMFCAVVFIKQVNFLQQTDLGINRRNVAAIQTRFLLPPHYADLIKQVPGIVDALPITGNNFLMNMSSSSGTQIYEKNGERASYTTFNINADARFFDFFGVDIIEGAGFSNLFEDSYPTVVNETFMKELEGVLLTGYINKIGVARDFYLTPTTKARPTRIYYPGSPNNVFRAIAYRYEENTRQQTQQSVTQWLRNEFPEQGEFEIDFVYMEDIFEEHFKSERALLKLLSVMTLACILIAVFGVYSLTSLSCQQRRKEIAIRKVYGAEVLDIMNIFFKEYLILLAMAALAAFPAGYLIMKRWLEGYVKQTSMDAWLFVAIFLIVFAVIVFSIFSMVWKAANQNPAEVVKSE